jgi:hypothetical protein
MPGRIQLPVQCNFREAINLSEARYILSLNLKSIKFMILGKSSHSRTPDDNQQYGC